MPNRCWGLRTSRKVVAAAVVFLATVSVTRQAEAQQSRKFEWLKEGPANACGDNCREWVSANGMITEETPQQFADFAKGRDLSGARVVLDSVGGDVLAGVWLGREFRRRGMATTVGTTQLLLADASGERRAALSKGRCKSICAFVLLGGVLRYVPAAASVSVHQIWPTDRRSDAMAATYSAADLTSVLRQFGQLSHYTIEMGGDIALFEMAMRIPPWEVLRPLTAEEMRRLGLNNVDVVPDRAAVKLAAPKSGPALPARPSPVSLDNPKASSWQIVDQAGVTILARKYPLTSNGDVLGHFELSFACDGKENLKVAYSETRRIDESSAVRVTGVGIGVGKLGSPLPVGSSLRNLNEPKLDSTASGRLSATFIAKWTRDGGQPLHVVSLDSSKVRIASVVGPSGLAAAFPKLVAKCKD
jgi:hypothetical protein